MHCIENAIIRGYNSRMSGRVSRRVTRSETKIKIQQKVKKSFNSVTLECIFSHLDRKSLKSAEQVRKTLLLNENINDFLFRFVPNGEQ